MGAKELPVIIATLESVPGFQIVAVLGVAVIEPSIYGFVNSKKPKEIWESVQEEFEPIIREMGGNAVLGARFFPVDNGTSHPEARMYGTVVTLRKIGGK